MVIDDLVIRNFVADAATPFASAPRFEGAASSAFHEALGVSTGRLDLHPTIALA